MILPYLFVRSVSNVWCIVCLRLQVMGAELVRYSHVELIENAESGFAMMLLQDNIQDMSRLFTLFCSVQEGLVSMASIFQNHVATVVTPVQAHDQDGAVEASEVTDMITLGVHHKYHNMMTVEFQGNELFTRALYAAFNIHLGDVLIADVIRASCDRLLVDAQIDDPNVVENIQRALQFMCSDQVFSVEDK